MNIKILYEDESLLCVDKPAGLIVHSDGRTEEPTLVDWIRENYPALEEVGEDQIVQNKILKRPGIIHRLDRDTSGVLLIAKTASSFEFLKNQFQQRKVEKIYRAFVWGKFSEEDKSGVITKPIGRSVSDFRRWSAEGAVRGEQREAETHYEILAQDKLHAYLEVRPKTGRTHQIRVHMKAIKHPIIGDKLYGPKNGEALGFERLALHALSISLELPDGSHIKIESELPPDFQKAEELLQTQ